MNGCLIPDTPIAVDYWRTRNCPETKLFFLTHMHADHTSGLSPSWKSTIYCSPVSAKLLRAKFEIQQSLIQSLEVGVGHVIPLDEYGHETMTVTPIDANHCPGSVIYLFVGYFGTVLYTGDFRYTSDMFLNPPLCKHLCVDVLYLDNTYNNPNCLFPSREECTAKIIEIIQSHPQHDVKLGMHTLGKENLLVDIARAVQEWIVVSPSRYSTLEQLKMPNVFTTETDAGRIHLVSSYQITKKIMKKWNDKRPTIGILPTALYTSLNGQPYSSQKDVFVVPYSDHSSYYELFKFVSQVRPKTIIPIVKQKSFGVFGSSISDLSDMRNFKECMNPEHVVPFEIPITVVSYMKSTHQASTDSELNFMEISDKITHVKRIKQSRSLIPKRVTKGVVYSDSPRKSLNDKPPFSNTTSATTGSCSYALKRQSDDCSSDCKAPAGFKTLPVQQHEIKPQQCKLETSNKFFSAFAASSNKGRKRKLPASLCYLQKLQHNKIQRHETQFDNVFSDDVKVKVKNIVENVNSFKENYDYGSPKSKAEGHVDIMNGMKHCTCMISSSLTFDSHCHAIPDSMKDVNGELKMSAKDQGDGRHLESTNQIVQTIADTNNTQSQTLDFYDNKQSNSTANQETDAALSTTFQSVCTSCEGDTDYNSCVDSNVPCDANSAQSTIDFVDNGLQSELKDDSDELVDVNCEPFDNIAQTNDDSELSIINSIDNVSSKYNDQCSVIICASIDNNVASNGNCNQSTSDPIDVDSKDDTNESVEMNSASVANVQTYGSMDRHINDSVLSKDDSYQSTNMNIAPTDNNDHSIIVSNVHSEENNECDYMYCTSLENSICFDDNSDTVKCTDSNIQSDDIDQYTNVEYVSIVDNVQLESGIARSTSVHRHNSVQYGGKKNQDQISKSISVHKVDSNRCFHTSISVKPLRKCSVNSYFFSVKPLRYNHH
uniref:5' exonuclease Apollo n=1 Tax=Saccoglossus kowalevskii TaxID=10224 RepID=A0ABM0GIC4_SACKO|nr:PREDICTED: uncharacterized protein LOC100372601 [Saccoglossus kowalevskii]